MINVLKFYELLIFRLDDGPSGGCLRHQTLDPIYITTRTNVLKSILAGWPLLNVTFVPLG